MQVVAAASTGVGTLRKTLSHRGCLLLEAGSKELVESRTGIQQQNCLRVIGKVETFDRHTMIGSCCEEHTIAQLHAVVAR